MSWKPGRRQEGGSGPQGRGLREGATGPASGERCQKIGWEGRESVSVDILPGGWDGRDRKRGQQGGGHEVREVWPAVSWTVSSTRAQVDQGDMLLLPGKGGHEGWGQMSVCLCLCVCRLFLLDSMYFFLKIFFSFLFLINFYGIIYI